jgi:DNA excision repair protein ERCC-2
VALQAPTGWGKTIAALAVIKELGARPALWLTPRLSISLHIFQHAINMGFKTIATAGREKLCAYGYTALDFMRGACRGCALNRPVSLTDLQLSDSLESLDFGRIKELGESLQVCPYSLQTVLERYRFDLIVSHYNRIHKLIRVNPRVIIVDEAHNLTIPKVHQMETRVLALILEKMGFSESEISSLIQSPEALKAVLTEMLDMILTIDDDELRPYIEELVGMLQTQVWYYDPSDTINAIEVPEIPRNINAKIIFLSATLPPQMINSPYVIIIHRGWNIPVRIDARFVLSYENIMRRGNEIREYIKKKYLTNNGTTIVFTTLSREDLIDNSSGDVVWEDEITTPCQYKGKTIVLRVFGRFNEGIDINCADRVVVLGLPLLPPGAMQRLAARGIDEKSFITTVLTQIIGRVFRSSEPPPRIPEVYLVDKRFLRIKDELQKYEIEVVNA